MLTLVSPLANLPRSALAGDVPSRSQIVSARPGWEVPEKICTPRMAGPDGLEGEKGKGKSWGGKKKVTELRCRSVPATVKPHAFLSSYRGFCCKLTKMTKFPEVQGGGSLILAWQVRSKHVLVVGGGEVS